MKRQAAFPEHWISVSRIMLVLIILSLLAACSGSGKPDPSKADLNKPVTTAGWKITLKGVPETQQIVGGGGVTHQAENGQYIIIPAEVTNMGSDIILFPEDLIYLKDSAGKEWKLASSTPQFAYKQTNPEVDILMDSPVAAGDTRKTVLMFDVSSDASGFVLIFHGDSTIFKLGY